MCSNRKRGIRANEWLKELKECITGRWPLGSVFAGHANLCHLCREHRWKCHEELLTRITEQDDSDEEPWKYLANDDGVYEQHEQDFLEGGDTFEENHRRMKKEISGAEARRTCERIAEQMMKALVTAGETPTSHHVTEALKEWKGTNNSNRKTASGGDDPVQSDTFGLVKDHVE